MPALAYTRIDHQVIAEVAQDNWARLEVVAAGTAWSTTRRLAGDADADFDLTGLGAALPGLPPRVALPDNLDHQIPDRPRIIDRVTLRVPTRLAHLDWNAALVHWAAGRPIVRTSSVPPTYVERPLPLPLRIAEVGLPDRQGRQATPPAAALRDFVEAFTGSARRDFQVKAVQTMASMARRLHTNVRVRDWPTVDVLHLLGPLPDDVADPDPHGAAGSLGWIEQAAATYQVRLVLLDIGGSSGSAQPRLARELAARLVERGGPAVLLVPAESTARYQTPALHAIVAGLVHDEPLDSICGRICDCELFAGAGREEATRVSTGMRLLAETPKRASQGVGKLGLPVVEHEAASRALDSLHSSWETLDFGGEGRGMFPSARRIADLGRVVGPRLPSRGHRAPWAPPTPVSRPKGRFLNAHLQRPAPDGAPATEQQQHDPPLVAEQEYLLRLDVGPLSTEVAAIEPVALLFEDRMWDRKRGGLWAELTVAGVGCTVVGGGLQPLWVPVAGPSEPRYFRVRMDRPGIAVLRYTIHRLNNVVQSFRLAAIVAGDAGDRDPVAAGTAGSGAGERATAEQLRRLALALGLKPTEVGGRSWYARLDYSAVTRMDEAGKLPGREVAIVANRVGDAPLITIKGSRAFEALDPKDIDTDVRAVRAALNEITRPDGATYGFGLPGDPNAADQQYYDFALGKLANAGRRLFERVAPLKDSADLRRDLGPPGARITVAHALRDKVIPWALVYDRPYDAGRRKLRGQPVEHVACAAPLPATGSPRLAASTCGTDPTCQLHPDRLAERAANGQELVSEDTVACPLGFWGFRHQIELPPQQVDAGGTAKPVGAEISAPRRARVLLGFNATLESLAEHQADITNAIRRSRRGGEPGPVVTDRDDVVDALADADLDVVYLYCHALGDEGQDEDPRLQFDDPQDDPQAPAPPSIAAHQLPDVSWSHHPLVVLNACGTTGFSSRATSVFLTALVDRRDASAMLGADVAVHEYLAAEIGRAVVAGILDEQAIGDALYGARLALLARRNPLGLVYTLYGSLELRLAR